MEFKGYKREPYGIVDFFSKDATRSQILDQLPKKLKRLINKAKTGAHGIGEIELGSFEIIFHAADPQWVFNPLADTPEEKASIAIKMNLLVPMFDNLDTHAKTGTDNIPETIKEAVNTIQWVQEYIQAIGEEHKDAYVEGLEKAMELLMGKKTMNFDGDDQPCPPPPKGSGYDVI